MNSVASDVAGEALFVANDVVRVWSCESGERDGDLVELLYLGDRLAGVIRENGQTQVRLPDGRTGWVHGPLETRSDRVLELAFIDVGQGDACLITAPNGSRLLVDGGETQQIARYLAALFQHQIQQGETISFDAFVITHGDADHFEGLNKLVLEAANESREQKRIRVATARVFHNGLVKRPGAGTEALGPTAVMEGGRVVLRLVDDPRDVQADEANRPFVRWRRSLEELAGRVESIEIRRLDAEQQVGPFDFLGNLGVEVLGPLPVSGPDGEPALPWLGSASATINGHSLTLRLTYGHVRILLGGDLTRRAEAALLKHHGPDKLAAEVLKAPHHGADDVDLGFLRAVQPLVTIVSAGDDNARNDHLHPRANVLGALGKAGRGDDPLIFVTNLAAFDRFVGPAYHAKRSPEGPVPDTDSGWFYARERTAFGIVHVRTDGERLLVVRRGARPTRYEAYVFQLGAGGSSERVDARSI